jgi:hypothetical protein
LSGFLLERINGRRVGTALINGDLVRQAVLADGFLEETQRGLLVPAGG